MGRLLRAALHNAQRNGLAAATWQGQPATRDVLGGYARLVQRVDARQGTALLPRALALAGGARAARPAQAAEPRLPMRGWQHALQFFIVVRVAMGMKSARVFLLGMLRVGDALKSRKPGGLRCAAVRIGIALLRSVCRAGRPPSASPGFAAWGSRAR